MNIKLFVHLDQALFFIQHIPLSLFAQCHSCSLHPATQTCLGDFSLAPLSRLALVLNPKSALGFNSDKGK